MDFALFAPVLPELILAIGAMALSDARRVHARWRWPLASHRVAGDWRAAGGGLPSASHRRRHATVFDGAFVSDGMTRFLKVLVLVAAALTLLLTMDDFGRANV